MIELFSDNTPNGKKISIMLEEINFEYKFNRINIKKINNLVQLIRKLIKDEVI